MSRLLLALAGFTVAAALVWADDSAPAKKGDGSAEKEGAKDAAAIPAISAELKSDKQKASYAIGYAMGVRIRKQFGLSAMDSAAMLRGMQDSLGFRKSTLSRAESDQALQRYKEELLAEQEKQAAAVAEGNRKRGEVFLAENKKKPGVVTLPSGLEYLVLKEGTGKQPNLGDSVKVHYHGTLLDGSVFDSSVNRGEPLSFSVKGVIKGWTEVLQLMKEGAKWRVFIPSNLAYGSEGSQKIGPNEMLTFEIELLKVE